MNNNSYLVFSEYENFLMRIIKLKKIEGKNIDFFIDKLPPGLLRANVSPVVTLAPVHEVIEEPLTILPCVVSGCDNLITSVVDRMEDPEVIDVVSIFDANGEEVDCSLFDFQFGEGMISQMSFLDCLKSFVDTTKIDVYDRYKVVEKILKKKFSHCQIDGVRAYNINMPMCSQDDIEFMNWKIDQIFGFSLLDMESFPQKLVKPENCNIPKENLVFGLRPIGQRCHVLLDNGHAFVWMSGLVYHFLLDCEYNNFVVECSFLGNYEFVITDVLSAGRDVRNMDLLSRMKCVGNDQFPGFKCNNYVAISHTSDLSEEFRYKGYFVFDKSMGYFAGISKGKFYLDFLSNPCCSLLVKDNDVGERYLWARVGNLIVPYCPFDSHYAGPGCLDMVFVGEGWDYLTFEYDDLLPNFFFEAMQIEENYKSFDAESEANYDVRKIIFELAGVDEDNYVPLQEQSGGLSS